MNVLDLLSGVFFSPVRTLRSVAESKPLGWAAGILVFLTLLSLVADPFEPPMDILQEYGLTVAAGRLGVATTVFSILLPALVIVVTHVVARAFRPGELASFASAYAFANVPSLLELPLQLLARTSAAPLTGLLGLALSVWLLVLHVLAVRESYGFRTGGAVLVSLLAFLGVGLITAVLAIVWLLPAIMASLGA